MHGLDSFLWAVPDAALAFVLLGPLTARIVVTLAGPDNKRDPLDDSGKLLVAFAAVVSVLAYVSTAWLVPRAGKKLIAKLNGVDLGKLPRQAPIPQSLGLVSGTAFLVCLVLLQLACARLRPAYVDKLDALMLSVCFSVLLGLADDVMDIRWGHKLFMGLIMGLPLATQYDGPTSILVPSPFHRLLDARSPLHEPLKLFNVYPSPDGAVLELFSLYLVYVVALSVFCTNAINIYAGINGIEVGQSVIVAGGVVVMDLWEISTSTNPASANSMNHVFSLVVMLPFLATALGLLKHNWFPARVFIGDVFPYYAGMTFAATAILGHYSRTLLLFLVPQVLNYLYSVPQIFGFVPCPRHRLPKVNPETFLLEPSTVSPESRRPNMTLINLVLGELGPTSERSLTIVLLVVQSAFTGLALYLREVLARALF